MTNKVPIRDALELYWDELDSQNYAASTRQMYEAKLRRFRDFYESCQRELRHVPYVSSIEPTIIARYFKLYNSPCSRNDALKALRGFMRWAVRMKYITAEDAAGALDRRMAKVERKPKHYIPAEDFPRMLDIAGEYSPQHRAVVSLALFTLCRVSEITALRLRDIDLIGSKAQVWRQKRKRHTVSVIGPDLHEELDRWLSWYAGKMGYPSPAAMMAAHPDWLLIPRINQDKVQENGRYVSKPERCTVLPETRAYRLELVIKRVLVGLGIAGEAGFQRTHLWEGMHTIRRSGARALWLHLTNVVGHERALMQVSKMLDHEDIKVTLRYIGADLEKAELDTYLASNRMYGDLRPAAQGDAAVVPLRGIQLGAERTNAPGPIPGTGAEAQGL